MSSLTASGVGSGLDVPSIVSQLMSLERRPLDQLNALGTKLNAQISAYGQLKSALSTFQSAMKGLSNTDKFQVYSASSSDESIFTAVASKTASPSSHAIEVISLAKAHRLTSGSAGSPSYANSNTSIGATGVLELTQNIGGTPRTFQVNISNTNDTLAGIRDAINNAGDNTGVIASVVNTGSQAKLILSAKDTGVANQISVGANTSAGISSALGFETLAGNAPADASLKIDGLLIENSSNVLTNVIEGVTLTLKNSGSPQTLAVARDTASVTASVQKFVDAYNDVRKILRTLGGADGSLEGETVVKGVERKIQSIFNTSAAGLAYSHLSEIGIKTDPKTGGISLDGAKLDSVLAANYSGVADLFADKTQGFAVRFEAAASSMISAAGIIESRKEGINTRVSDVNKRISSMEYRLDLVEKKYRAQFTALDGLVARLQSTGNFLTQQLANLPG